MTFDRFEFTPLRMHTPSDNLTTAIGLIQAEILAADTTRDAAVTFGSTHFQRSTLEAALALLAPLIETCDDQRWPKD